MGVVPSCHKPDTLDDVDWVEAGVYDEGTKLEGYGPILYHAKCPRNVNTNRPELANYKELGLTNMYQVIEAAAKKFGPKRCAGQRKLIKVHKVEENGRMFEKYELANHYDWITYDQYFERVKAVGRGIHRLANPESQDYMIIYAETQRDWMISAYAGFSRNLKIVTVYATLGAEGASYAFNQTKAAICVVDAKLMSTLSDVIANCRHIKHVITLGEVDASRRAMIQSSSVTVTSIEDVIKLGGKDQGDVPIREPALTDIGFVMYTSGTTGNPKGVLINHKTLVATIYGCQLYMKECLLTEDDVFLGYLPLAHIMEVIGENACFSIGMSIGFGNPHTLSESGVKLKRPESEGDGVVLQPTFIIMAPAVLEKVFANINRKVSDSGGLKKFFFNKALDSGISRSSHETGAGSFWDFIVCQKIQALLGGRIRFIIAGSAALSRDVQVFIQTLFNCPVRQGYGLTETAALSTVQMKDDFTTGVVGGPALTACIRLADWAEGNYLVSDEIRPDVGMPRGEVLISGHSLSDGYLVDPIDPDPELVEKNRTDFIELNGMRWFRTGDIGQIRPNGTLQIIDRKKDLWKGPNGEYVALQKVESVLKLVPCVDMAMCYGAVGGKWPIALVCVNEAQIMAKAKENGITGSFSQLCENTQIVRIVEKQIKEKCKEQRLLAFEIPEKVVLISELWTPENEMLTAAMKLKRPCIAEKHMKQIEAVVNSNQI